MLDDKITQLIRRNTVIDAGHYSYLDGPTDLDGWLWNLGVRIYSKSKNFGNLGLMLIGDDMKGVESNLQRKSFDVRKLPGVYSRVLKQHRVSEEEIKVLSQNDLREIGRKLIRKKRVSIPMCELIAATSHSWRQSKHYDNAILLYDESKTDGGINLFSGVQKSVEVFGTRLETHCFVFRDKANFSYFTTRQNTN